jgi:hypothetical protein
MSKDNSVGAIWEKNGQYGVYLSISIEIDGKKYNYTAFKNKYKQEGDNKPDFKIMPPKSQNNEVSKVDKLEDRIAFVKAEKAKYAQKSAIQQDAFINEEDVPF